MHSFTLHWDKRPYGAAALLAGFTVEEGPQLYTIDNSGVSFVLLFKVANLFFSAEVFRLRIGQERGPREDRAR